MRLRFSGKTKWLLLLPLTVLLTGIVVMFYKQEHPDVEAFVVEFEACPSWLTVQWEDVEPRTDVLLKLQALARYDAAAIRAAMVRHTRMYGKGQQSIDNVCNYRILNRLLFQVPSEVPEETPVFGGWIVYCGNGASRDELWPISIDKQGQIGLTGKAIGYLGPRYRFLEEFDYFHSKYGLRQKTIDPTAR